jgi:hypothetical protein
MAIIQFYANPQIMYVLLLKVIQYQSYSMFYFLSIDKVV